MGTVRLIFLSGALLALAQPALAQQDSAPPALQDFRLDPARDPNRPTTPLRAGPEIDNRPAVPLPSGNAAATPRTTPAQERVPQTGERTTVPPAGAPIVPQSTAPAPSVTETPQLPVETMPQPSALPSNATAPNDTALVDEPESPAFAWPWIVGGLLLAGALAFLFLKLRRKDADPDTAVMAAPADAIAPAAAPAPAPAPRVVPPPVRVPSPPPPPSPVATADPVSLHFTPVSARTTLAGAQIDYRLTLRNDSGAAVEGLAVAAFIANADARQPQALAAFYADAFAREAHRITNIAPGASVTVEGALQIAAAQMAPIEVQGRSLLIPLVAFKAISLDGDEMARGAFIVGQESTPPGARMAPFRIDQGPRQFRGVGSRPAQALIAA